MNFWLAVVIVIKAAVIMVAVISAVPVLVWFERRGAGWIQNRRGPNRIRLPLTGFIYPASLRNVLAEKFPVLQRGILSAGLLYPIADAIKFAFKEDIIPEGANKIYYMLAPMVMIVTALMAYAVIPLAPMAPIEGVTAHFPPTVNGIPVPFMVAPVDIGILFIFAIMGLGVYGIVMAGWSSNSNYALLGSLRSTAQMISYEVAMALSVVGIILLSGSIDLNQIVVSQSSSIIQWNFIQQILGFVVFITAAFAETNRLPFDLPEGESEIVAGYHVEYGSMKFMLFYFAEYIAIVTSSMLIVTLYFGGWSFPGLNSAMDWFAGFLSARGLGMSAVSFGVSLLPMAVFAAKTVFFMALFVWVRWTLPRFRYDQLMRLGWKVMLPLALLNIILTAAFLV